VFRKNQKYQQSSLFDNQFLLPPKLLQQMETSWAHTFYHELFERITEERFGILFSDEDSRPNAPVNVLVGADMRHSVSHLQAELLNDPNFYFMS